MITPVGVSRSEQAALMETLALISDDVSPLAGSLVRQVAWILSEAGCGELDLSAASADEVAELLDALSLHGGDKVHYLLFACERCHADWEGVVTLLREAYAEIRGVG